MGFKRFVLIFLILVWALAVYTFSSQDADTSSGLSRRLVEIFIHNEETVNFIEPIVRKLAHFTEYAIGGILFMMLFHTYKWGNAKLLIVSGVMGAWYAGLDEFHQTMVQGRDGNALDVLIDTLGCLIGACIMLIIIKSIEYHKEKKKQEKFEKFKRRVRPGN